MAQSTPADAAGAESSLDDLPPSAKLVAKTLEYEGALTQSQLAEETRLPPRTVRSAIGQLESADLVAGRVSFTDARQQVYTLAGQREH